MNYNTRFLTTEEDLNQVIELQKLRPGVFRDRDAEMDLDHGGNKFVGAFDETGLLVGTLRIIEWSILPFYTIGTLFIRPGLTKGYDFSDEHNPMPGVLDFAIEHMESRNFYTWYYSRAMSPGYRRLELNRKDFLSCTKLGSRYLRQVSEIVPAGERSKYSLHDKHLMNQTWEKDTLIVMCTLPNELRSYKDVFRTE